MRILTTLLLSAAVAMTTPSGALADDLPAPLKHTKAGDLGQIVYVRISNLGKESDALLSAGSDVTRAVELHETVREGGDISMRALSRIAIPANGKVEMKPGGTFIMLRGLTRDLNRGDKVRITLTFERARPISFQAPVLEAPPSSNR